MVRQQLQASKHGWTTPLRNAGAIKAQLPGGADGAAANLFVYKKAPPIPAPGLPQTPNPVRISRYVSVTSLFFYISTGEHIGKKGWFVLSPLLQHAR